MSEKIVNKNYAFFQNTIFCQDWRFSDSEKRNFRKYLTSLQDFYKVAQPKANNCEILGGK